MPRPRILAQKKKILGKNDQLAQDLGNEFAPNGVFVANLVSSPGVGKTELLRATLAELRKTHRPAAITGDLATENDAARPQAASRSPVSNQRAWTLGRGGGSKQPLFSC